MDRTTLKGIARESIGWSIGLSVVMILMGMMAIGAPLEAGVAVNLLVAWLLVLSGVVHLGFAWHTRGAGGVVWELLVSAVYLLAGLYLFMNPLVGLVSLTVVLAAYLVVKGLAEFAFSLTLRPVPGSGWLLFDGIVSVILGILIGVHLPSSTTWVVGTLVGLAILFSGVSRLVLSLAARKVVQKLA
jgi:uncharacterized membrane protein HdeD (DUF308 family)